MHAVSGDRDANVDAVADYDVGGCVCSTERAVGVQVSTVMSSPHLLRLECSMRAWVLAASMFSIIVFSLFIFADNAQAHCAFVVRCQIGDLRNRCRNLSRHKAELCFRYQRLITRTICSIAIKKTILVKWLQADSGGMTIKIVTVSELTALYQMSASPSCNALKVLLDDEKLMREVFATEQSERWV